MERVQKLIEDFENEVAVLKTTLEASHAKGDDFVPMVIFYSSPTSKDIVVVPVCNYPLFEDRMQSIAETLHLFTATDSSTAIVVFASTMLIEDETTHVLNIFVLSTEDAYIIHLPFDKSNPETVTWISEHDSITPIDEYDFDDLGKELVSMFYTFTHQIKSPFSAAEVLSYLSNTGAAIIQFNQKYEYYDFSETEQLTP